MDAKINKFLHDADIYCIEKNSLEKTLILKINCPHNILINLKFNEVICWDLYDFQEQNIIFEISFFKKKNIPEFIKEEFKFISDIASNDFELTYINSSVGLGGIIISLSVSLQMHPI